MSARQLLDELSTPVKVAVFVTGLGVAFAAAAGVGAVTGPIGAEPAAHSSGHEPRAGSVHRAGHETTDAATSSEPGGLSVSESGYHLALDRPVSRSGDAVPVSFSITGPDGRAVVDFEEKHAKRLHLIAVRRDFTGFQHVHPVLATTGENAGRWSTALDLTPGQWRVFADFTATGGTPLTLGADLAVAGRYQPAAPAEQSRTASVDGYTVTLDGRLAVGQESRLDLKVTADGRPVTDLDPYLGAYGHLVALREGDLGYLHVHPDGHPGDGVTQPGPTVTFSAAVPSSGTYRLFLDFSHRGVVRTAAFTLDAGARPEPRAGSADGGHAGESDEAHSHAH